MNLNDKILDALTLLDIQATEVEESISETVQERLVELLTELLLLSESLNVTELPTLLGRRTIQRLQAVSEEIDGLSRQLSVQLTQAQHRAISGILGEVEELDESPFDVMEVLTLLGALGASSSSQNIVPYSPDLARGAFDSLYLNGLPRQTVWGRWMDRSGANVQSRVATILSEEMAAAFQNPVGGIQERLSRRVRNRLGEALHDTLLGASSSTLRGASGIVESEAMSVSNAFLRGLVDRNENVFRGQMLWSAILDGRNCVRCGNLHGSLVDVENGIRPPIHMLCRCRLVPLVTGEGSPETVSFGDWLRRQSQGTQEHILGVRGAEMFRSGEIRVTDFVSTRGRRVPRRRTLEEIERRR